MVDEKQNTQEIMIIPAEDPKEVRLRDNVPREFIGREVMQTFKIAGGDRDAMAVGRHAPSGQAALAVNNGQHERQ